MKQATAKGREAVTNMAEADRTESVKAVDGVSLCSHSPKPSLRQAVLFMKPRFHSGHMFWPRHS